MENPDTPSALEIADNLDETHKDVAIRQGRAVMDRLRAESELARQRRQKRLAGEALQLAELPSSIPMPLLL